VAVKRLASALGSLDPPGLERTEPVNLADRPVIGDVEQYGRHGQGRVSPQVMVRQYQMPQVMAVGRREPLAPIVGRQPELTAARRRFQAPGFVRLEANPAIPQSHRGHVRLLARTDRSAVAAGAAVDPVVQPPGQAVDKLLNVLQTEAGV
jgi:hypothetical protein